MVKNVTPFHVRFFCNSNGLQNGDQKLHFKNPLLDLLYPDFEVGYLYEFVVEFAYNLH